MKKLFLFIFLGISICSYGQKLIDIHNSDLLNHQACFIGGNDLLKKLVATYIRYPENIKYATMIGIIEIDQEKDVINSFTVNSPGDSYDKEFNRVAQLTKGKWEKNDTINTLYITLTLQFKSSSSNYFVDYDSQPSFILGNIFIVNYADENFDSDESLINSLNENYKNQDYKKVLKISKELISRNPFYPNLYLMRIKALKELQKDPSEEIWFLTEFLNNKQYQSIM